MRKWEREKKKIWEEAAGDVRWDPSIVKCWREEFTAAATRRRAAEFLRRVIWWFPSASASKYIAIWTLDRIWNQRPPRRAADNISSRPGQKMLSIFIVKTIFTLDPNQMIATWIQVIQRPPYGTYWPHEDWCRWMALPSLEQGDLSCATRGTQHAATQEARGFSESSQREREREKEPLMSHVFSGNGRGGHEMIITAFQTTTTTGEYRYEHKGGEQTQKSITFSPIGQNKSSSQQSNGVPLNIHQPADQTHF